MWAWVAFHIVVFSVLALDLGVLNRKSHVITMRQALGWTFFWVLLSLAFCGGIYQMFGAVKATEFLTGYVVEYALSVDNIFVFILVFSYFKVPAEHQHKVLFWGIIGAFIMRGAMILAGSALIHRFEWLIYVFGAFLIFTGLKLLKGDENSVDPDQNFAVKWLRRAMPVAPDYVGGQFFTRIDGRLAATPLLAVLLVVESTDLVFAVDSIPAVLAISRDSFIVYTSNICAILGLRSLYFALSGVMGMFHYLKYGLALVLTFVGAKMLLSHTMLKIPSVWSLAVIVSILGLSVGLSLLRPHPASARELEVAQADSALSGAADAAET